MLYDPKWEVKFNPKFSGVSLCGLISWLETQDPNARYDYCNPGICAAAQYLMAQGATGDDIFVDFGVGPEPGDEGYWLYQIVGTGAYTFGAALDRARKLAAA